MCNKKHWKERVKTFELLGYTSRGQRAFSGIRHGTQYTLWCILSIRAESLKQTCVIFFFLRSKPRKGEVIKINGNMFVLCDILKIVVTSAAEAELGALFLNLKEGKIHCLTLGKLWHIQLPTWVHCDNSTATGIANDSVKKQRSRSMEIRSFWISDKVKNGSFDVQWHPGQENLVDYYTKHFDTKHHIAQQPWYLQEDNSPRTMPPAISPSALQGGVGNLPDGYTK